MKSAAKALTAVTALVIAITGLVTALSGDDSPTGPVVIVLDSPESFRTFIEAHPSNS